MGLDCGASELRVGLPGTAIVNDASVYSVCGLEAIKYISQALDSFDYHG